MTAAKTKRTPSEKPSPDQRPARQRAVAREISFLLGRLRSEIKTRGFTLKGVAGALGWSPSSLSDVLRGQASVVPLDRVLLICRVIGLPSPELFLQREPTEQHLQKLLDTRRNPGQVLGRVDEAALMAAATELLTSAEKRPDLLSASERSYLKKVVQWCEASIEMEKRARIRRAGKRARKQGSEPGHVHAKRIVWPDFKARDK